MARVAESYRSARRNATRDAGLRFPWTGTRTQYAPPPPVRPNCRDRSKAAEKARLAREASDSTIDFCNEAGLSLMQVNRNPNAKTKFEKKPKRGWAAARRAAPFENYLAGERLAQAQARHIHPRHKRVTF